MLKNKKVIVLKEYFLGRCQYQNKKALFTDPIFSEGFVKRVHLPVGSGAQFLENGTPLILPLIPVLQMQVGVSTPARCREPPPLWVGPW